MSSLLDVVIHEYHIPRVTVMSRPESLPNTLAILTRAVPDVMFVTSGFFGLVVLHVVAQDKELASES
jgi:hypothetical protein